MLPEVLSPKEAKTGISILKAIRRRLIRIFGSPTLAGLLTEPRELQKAEAFSPDYRLDERWETGCRHSEYHDASFWNLAFCDLPDPEEFTRIMAQSFYGKPPRIEGIIPIGLMRQIVAEMAAKGKIKPSSRVEKINAVYQSLEENSLIPFSFVKDGDSSFGIPFQLH